MFEIFKLVISQTATLFIFISLGYWLKKSGKVTANFSKGLSVTLVNVISPMLTIRTFANNFKVEALAENAKLLGVSVIVLVICVAIGYPLAAIFSRRKGELDRNKFDVYIYSMSITNFGYFGYPLIEQLFGEKMLSNFMVFCIPFCIFIYTFGIYILDPNKVFSIKKLFNIPMLSMVVGMLLGLIDVQFPDIVKNVLATGGDCQGPVAMMMTGIVFASNNLKEMVCAGKVYFAYFIKLTIIPIIAIAVLTWLKVPMELAICIFVLISLPAGLNSIVFPEAFGGDSRTGAQICFVSTVLCVITIPVMMMLFSYFSGIPIV